MEDNTLKKTKLVLPSDEKVSNPSITMVGYMLKESKELHKSNVKHRVGKVNGKLEMIFTDERIKVYKDTSKFTKLFVEAGALREYNDLSSAAQRLMTSIIERIGYNEDWFYYVPGILAKDSNIAEPILSNYLKELLQKEWIYKSTEKRKYWINLVYICVGDRAEIYAKYKATQV